MSEEIDIHEFFKKYKNQNNKSKFYFKVKRLTYFMVYHHYKSMIDKGIGFKGVAKRLENGWRLEDAVIAPTFLETGDYQRWLRIKDWSNYHRIEYSQKANKFRKPKPWLKIVPQSVKPSAWFKHLSKNDIFPKVKI